MKQNNLERKFLVIDDSEYTYQRFIDDINLKENYYSYLYIEKNNPYEIFLSIIHSLVYDYPIEVLDGDFSEKELEEIGIDKKLLFIPKKVNQPLHFNNFHTLLNFIKENKKWSMTLYTSGTTGRPKKVTHSLSTLTRNVKLHDKFKDDIWAFAYNPTHMAGLQVFFQAFFNQNTMIYVFAGQQKNLPMFIDRYHITNISATSTYYRNIIPYLKNNSYNSLKRITFGGEKYDSNLETLIKEIFPYAKIRNIYASTEAGSLFVANGDVFEIAEPIQQLVKINEKNELLIHYTLLGMSTSFSLSGEWFNTGDLVEQVSKFQFKFLSRQSDMINVGGYKVNPIEVENILSKVPGVIDLLVKAKENRVTGRILVVDVVKEENFDVKELKKSIKQFASKHLQEWKVPRIIKFVNEIPKTRTGKKVRK